MGANLYVLAVAWRDTVRETEKPKVFGWSAKRRLRMVDLPEPEGPEITMGRWIWVAECRHCGISRCLRANAWFPSYLIAPWYVTVRAQVDSVESARAGRQYSEKNDASGQCSTYKSNCRKGERGTSSVDAPNDRSGLQL